MFIQDEFGVDFIFPVFDHIGISLFTNVGSIREKSFFDTLFFERVTIVLCFEGQGKFHGIGYRGVYRGTIFLRDDFLGITDIVLRQSLEIEIHKVVLWLHGKPCTDNFGIKRGIPDIG